MSKAMFRTRLALLATMFAMLFTTMLFTNQIETYAAYASVDEVVAKWGPGGEAGNTTWPSKLAGYFLTTQPVDVQNYTKITCNSQNYWYKTSNATAIINAGNSLDGDASVAQLDDYYNLEADVGGAAGLLSGFTGPFQTFLGILVTVITVGMTLFTAFDLCYIAFPVFRGKMDDAKANGTKGLTRTDKNGDTKLNLVTEDAQYAMVAADTIQTGKNPFVIYFEKRVISFIVLAVLLFILLTGNINILTNIGVKLASGILNAINNTF